MIRVILEGDPKEEPSTWSVSVDREAQAAGSFCRGVLLVLEVELGPRDGKEVDWQTANRLRQAVRRHVPAIHDLHAASAIDELPLQITATLERGSASKAISTRLKAIADEEALLLKVDSNKVQLPQCWMGDGYVRKARVHRQPKPDAVETRKAKRQRLARAVTAGDDGREGGSVFRVLGQRPESSARALVCRIYTEGGGWFEIKAAAAAQPGTGQFRVLAGGGGWDRELRDAAFVAQTFLKLHSAWLERQFGGRLVHDPATTDVNMEVVSLVGGTEGASMGLAFTVVLAALYSGWCVRAPLGLSGCVSLSGALGAVSGLREKLSGAIDILGAGEERLSVIIPADNMSRTCKVVVDVCGRLEVPTRVCLPTKVASRLHVLAAPTLFQALQLALMPAPGVSAGVSSRGQAASSAAVPVVEPAPKPAAERSLALVRSLVSVSETAGVPVVVEVGVMEGGSGKLRLATALQAGALGAIESAKVLVDGAWAALKARAKPGAVGRGYDPGEASHHDVVVNLPDVSSRASPAVALPAAVGLLAVLLGRAVREDTAVVGEVLLDGEVTGYVGAVEVLVPLAIRNGIRRLVVPSEVAEACMKVANSCPQRWGGLEVVGIDDLVASLDQVLQA